MARASHGHFVSSARRSGVSSTPSVAPPMNHSMLVLFISPRPSVTPSASQVRARPRSSERNSSQAESVQKKVSKAFMVKRWSTPSQIGTVTAARHASACASRLPPSSRAISPVHTTFAAPTSAGAARRAQSDSPSTRRTSASSAMESGG